MLTEPGMSAFENISRTRRRELLFERVRAHHTWHFDRNRAYHAALHSRGLGRDINLPDLPMLLRPTAQTFKSYIDILGTPFPNEQPQAFLGWLADQLSVEISPQRVALFKASYVSLEALLQEFERIFSEHGFEVLTSSGTSGRPTILIRDQDAIQKTVESFYLSFQRYFGMQIDHRVIFIMPQQGRIAMARMAAFSLAQMGIPGDRFSFTIPYAATPDQIRIRTGRTYRSGWQGWLEKQVENPFMNWMYTHYVSPRAVRETLNLLLRSETAGEKVLVFGSWSHLHEAARQLQAQNRRLKLAEGSVIGTGGGFKELYPFTTGQIRSDLAETFRSADGEPLPFRDVYGMAEANWAAMQCRCGNYHIPPWVLTAVLDENDRVKIGQDDEGILAFYDPVGGGNLFPAFFRTSDRVRLVNGLLGEGPEIRCQCGAAGEYILQDSIQRVDRLDEAGCAGQV